MGTLFDQRARTKQVGNNPGFYIAEQAFRISEHFGCSIREALKCIELEYKINDYDIKDEQLIGFGELIQELIEVLREGNTNENSSD